MKIAPIDIAHKSFERKLMGFNPEDVMEFLRSVADQMEEVIRERNSLKEALREKELSIMDYKERDETLKNTITTATKMSDRICADAEREAKLIINDANQKAEMIVKDARDSLKRMYQEIAEMKKTRLQFEQNLRAIVQAHLAMIDQSHQLMPNPQINMPVANAAAAASPSAGTNSVAGHPHASAHSAVKAGFKTEEIQPPSHQQASELRK